MRKITRPLNLYYSLWTETIHQYLRIKCNFSASQVNIDVIFISKIFAPENDICNVPLY
jgi:hypothetical protein